MKCKHCGAELKQLFYMNSWYCPNDCDCKTKISNYLEELAHYPTMVARKPGEFKKGDKVRVIKKIDSDNCYGVGDEFYIIRQGRGSTLGPTFKCSLCLNGPYECFIYPDELELVE